MTAQLLLLGGIPFRRRFTLEALAQVVRQVLIAGSFPLPLPRFPREGRVLDRVSGRLDAEVVPSHLAGKLGEGITGHLVAGV